MNALNIFHLVSAAHFMEMNKSVDGAENLCEQTQKSLDKIKDWRWSELLMALKQFQNQHLGAISLAILDKFLNSLVARIASSSDTSTSPSACSSDSSGFILSCDTKSSESLKSNSFRAMWWFEDLVVLEARVIEMLVRLMVSRNFESGVISRFLFYYQKSRFAFASSDEKVQIIERVVEMLGFLDVNCVSCKSLFEMLRVALKLKVSKCCRNKLESAIGSLLDQATLDNLLIPASPSKCYLYNVDLVVSFLKSFLGKGVDRVPLSRLENVASLIDLYLAEIAPDPCLKPSKFLAVIRALPKSARGSFNGVYHVVTLYFEVHPGLSGEERRKLCCSLDYEKLSTEALRHLTQNANFPSEYAALALVSQQSKLKSLLQYAEQSTNTIHKGRKDQVVLYARKLNASGENEKRRPRLQGVEWRVLEVEKVCMKMQPQMERMRKSRMPRHSYGRFLPMLCS